jgi:hypothetical protein
MVKKFTILLYVAAASTLIAGVLHLNKVINTISKGEEINNADILFLVGGIAQVFWIVPIIRQWGKTWYSIGLVGTAVFILLWVITRIPENPISAQLNYHLQVNNILESPISAQLNYHLQVNNILEREYNKRKP